MQLENLINIGDRGLIKPCLSPDKTHSGSLFPAGYKQIQSGCIIKCGLGYQLSSLQDEAESWKTQDNEPLFYSSAGKGRIFSYSHLLTKRCY